MTKVRTETEVLHRLKILQNLRNSELSEEAKRSIETGIRDMKWFLGHIDKY